MSWLSILAATLTLAAPAEDSRLAVDASRIVNPISPLMYGSCIEDVNHEIYGGLYAQMIFGESFEEPPAHRLAHGWTIFGGQWKAEQGMLTAGADFGAKAVRDEQEIRDGTVSVQVRFHDDKGMNGGLIVRVNEPGIGADAWIGYEVSLSPRGHVMAGSHHHDYRLLKQVPATIQAGRWYSLRVDLKGNTLNVFLDDAKAPVITVTDDDPSAIVKGRVGVRTWGSNVDFRALTIRTPEGEVVDPFTTDPKLDGDMGLSGMWDAISTESSRSRLTWDADNPFNSTRSQKIERTSGNGMVGIANRGLNRWGLNVQQGRPVAGRLHLRQKDFVGGVIVALQSEDGSKMYANGTLADVGEDWSVHEFTMTPNATDPNARFALLIDGAGAVWVDQVSLAPTGEDLFKGLQIRGDIARALQKEGLTVLRYGGSMVNAVTYRWKMMIGDRDRRPQVRGTWYPYSTNGFGIEDFVQFCRAAGFEPVVTINIEETPGDAADLVEYLNGDATTEWGKKRAENGHPEPYAVKYLQIGNEEGTNDYYLERFLLLYDAMRPKDASVSYIIGAWWEPENPVSKRIVQTAGDKAALWDLHVGGDDPREGKRVDAMIARMRRLLQEWKPGTKLRACILEENGGRHNVARALGHASIVNAAQRHGDFIAIQCPANCLQAWKQNDNGWDQGQLFYTPSTVWGMPPYYAQQMASAAHQPLRVASESTSPGDDLDLTAARDEGGKTLVLKVVNAGDRPHRAAISIRGMKSLSPRAGASTLSGNLDAVNPPDDPERIAPREVVIEGVSDQFSHEFPARSYTILRLEAR
jgi:alpha-L-arabinofuranosidase